MNTKSARPSDHEGDTMERLTPIGTAATALFRSVTGPMKHLATVALILSLGVAAAYAQDESVKMTFSGTSSLSGASFQQPNASIDGDNFAGKGTLGSFTVANVRAISNVPGTSSTCSGSTQLFLPELAGAGVFRFRDGSLLEVNLTQGGDCIDLITGVAHCVLTFQITGGTGRLNNASGVLTMTETVNPAAADALGNLFGAAIGEYTGTISGVATDDDRQDREEQ